MYPAAQAKGSTDGAGSVSEAVLRASVTSAEVGEQYTETDALLRHDRRGGHQGGVSGTTQLPARSSRRALQEITDLDRLDRLIDRMPDVSPWQELLRTP
jgi:hypothetical protein